MGKVPQQLLRGAPVLAGAAGALGLQEQAGESAVGSSPAWGEG